MTILVYQVNWRTWIHLDYFNPIKVCQVNIKEFQVNNDIDDSLASRFLSKSMLQLRIVKFYYGEPWFWIFLGTGIRTQLFLFLGDGVSNVCNRTGQPPWVLSHLFSLSTAKEVDGNGDDGDDEPRG